MAQQHDPLQFMRNTAFLVFVLAAFTAARAEDINTPTKEKAMPVHIVARFEHIAVNAPDPKAMADWYTANLGFRVVRSSPAPSYSAFIVDSAGRMMFELYNKADQPMLDPGTLHYQAMHFAMAADSILEIRERLLKAGAAMAEAIKTTASGDKVLMMRDPWGFALQFVQRVKPMLDGKGLYSEHYALNVTDSRAKAKWLADNLGMIVVRDGKAPSYGMFIADAGRNMMMELYQDAKYPVIDFQSVNCNATHLAFMVSDIAAAKAQLTAAGATVAEDILKTPGGDYVLMLRDPWGEPLQIVTRVAPMVK